MQRLVCPSFKHKRNGFCLCSYLLVFRFRLSRWIFLLWGDLNLLQKLWPFQMTVWVWHKPQMMKRGEAWPFLVLCQALPVAKHGGTPRLRAQNGQINNKLIASEITNNCANIMSDSNKLEFENPKTCQSTCPNEILWFIYLLAVSWHLDQTERDLSANSQDE